MGQSNQFAFHRLSRTFPNPTVTWGCAIVAESIAGGEDLHGAAIHPDQRLDLCGPITGFQHDELSSAAIA